LILRSFGQYVGLSIAGRLPSMRLSTLACCFKGLGAIPVLCGVLCAPLAALASGSDRTSLAERIRGADRAVVATAANVTASWRPNAHGDQLIVSQLSLQIEETLKGAAAERSVLVDIEGGTVGGYTLRVSSQPEVRPGERAVFLLDRSGPSTYVPHLKGQGILKLDAHDVVKGTTIGLDEIRQIAHATR
jgi:hypothetical protein